MHRNNRRNTLLAVIFGANLLVAGCATPSTATTAKAVEPVKMEAIGDTGVKRLTLTEKAAQRLAIKTAPVQQGTSEVGGAARLIIPYAALLYLPDGTTFTYTNPSGRSYVRETVVIERIQGDQAVLSSGPKIGTQVVITGGAELWGSEFGIK